MNHGIKLWDPPIESGRARRREVENCNAIVSSWSDERILNLTDVRVIYWILPWEILRELMEPKEMRRPVAADFYHLEGAVWGGVKDHILRIQKYVFGD